jgi:hypothetical protein
MHGTIKQRKNSSAVSSGRRLFAERLDLHDNAHSRRWNDLYRGYVYDLGGDDAISEAVRSLIRRIATFQCVLEQREAEYVKTGKASREATAEYQSLARAHAMMLKRVGLLGANKKPDEDEDDGLDPLTYVSGSHRTLKKKRSRLDDDEE